MSWLWGAATNPQYEELIEKACSPLNLPYPQSEDMSVNLEITDLIRSKAVQPKPAMQSLKRRVASKNGRVQMYSLGLIDTCIKNGGDHFLAEIASKEFVDEMTSLLRSTLTIADVKQMALQLFQQWAIAFKSKPSLDYLNQVYNELKSSGVQFPPPPASTSSVLLDTTTAPAWVDSDVCMRCRTAFTFTNRKHHCRNCGLVFDQACSSKTMPIPKFGIAQEVRVCEGCFVKSGRGTTTNGAAPAVPGRTPRSKQDLDADLQRAIELSLAESQPNGGGYVGSEPPLVRKSGSVEDDDEEMRLAIEASLREMEKARPSAPQGNDEPEYRPLPTYDLTGREAETILTFSSTMDQMAAYGERDLRRFPHAHVLAEQAYGVAGKLHRNAEEKTTKQQMLMEMQDKLSQAVGLYGQVLDGQQAYAARMAQEAQHRQYYSQQQSYAQYAPPQQYAPAPNGYPNYAPSQPQYAPPPQASRAGPSLYPTIPNTMPQYAQQAYQPQQYQPPPQEYRPESAHPQQYPSYPLQAPAAPQWASSPPVERQTSLRIPSSQRQPETPQRHSSMTYGQQPSQPGYEVPSAPFAPSEPSAPPAIDMSTHPSSPTASTNSALTQLPPQSSSYVSPSPASHQPLPTSPAQAQQPYHPQQQQQHQQQPSQIQYQTQSYPPQPYPPQQPQPQHQVQQSQTQPQRTPQNLYYDTSFPSAPAAVFPDAPVGTLEKQEKEEALLIEL